MAYTDIHQHLLWGIDDGAKDAAAMGEMIRASKEQNVLKICATPHACPGFVPFDMGIYNERISEARQNPHGVEIMSGAEIAWTYQTPQALRKGLAPTLNGTDYALIELWHEISWQEVADAAREINRAGFIPVFAHIERYRCFVWQPEKALALKNDLSVAYQMNASTVLDKNGLMVSRFVRRMLDERAIDAVASDSHDTDFRPQRLEAAIKLISEKWGADYAQTISNFDGVNK